jgi:hypothetical protein
MESNEITHTDWSWQKIGILFLGAWLIATSVTFSSHCHKILLSDLMSGLLLFFLGIVSIFSGKKWPLLIVALVGLWLQFAPLLFWAPEAISYLNDTLIGILAIVFAQLIPPRRVVINFQRPAGWSFNPSTWIQRFPTILLCTICWFIARYMAAYQLGYLDSIWDPIFGNNGTLKVITSSLSKSFPISDAGLGALVYSLEMLLGFKGNEDRWYKMPWMVIIFGLMVIPAGIVSILLIISQPLIVGHWCSWCLLTALLMLFMIAFTLSEVTSVLQFLLHVRRQKLPFWKIFWKGADDNQMTENLESLSITQPSNLNSIKGVYLPWNLALCLLIGLWMMFSPPLFSSYTNINHAYQILGALIVTVTCIATSESARAFRFLNVLLGSCLLIIPFLFEDQGLYEEMNGLIAGSLLILFTIRKGPIYQSYGPWNRLII